jgi:tRNA-dihydrouridine synthase B
MAGVSDLPFRLINRQFGCSFAFTEMISARGLVYENWRTMRMFVTSAEDKPLGVQILGAEEETLRRAVDMLQEYPFDVLDFNAACPVRKVVRRGEGAALLREPRELNRLLSLIVSRSRIPVTVKIRAGWDNDSVNGREIALCAQDAGVSALFIHGRTKTQGYNGSVDYEVIRDAKEAVSIPVIGSGDVFSASQAKSMLERTGCDAVAVARGALGNPWIFRELVHFLETGHVPERPSFAEIIDTMRRHLNLLALTFGELNAIVHFRKFFIWYTKGFPEIKAFRPRVTQVKTREEMEELIGSLPIGRPSSPIGDGQPL